MRLLTTLLIIFSAGCSTIPLPDSNLCIVNAPGNNKKCYNLARDYYSDGSLKATAKPAYYPLASIADLNKNAVMDEQSLANLKAFIRLLREAHDGP